MRMDAPEFGFKPASSQAPMFVDLPGSEMPALPRPTMPQGLGRRALMRACLFMETHLGEPLSLEAIARAACVSRSHFARMFRLSTGRTVMEYLLERRLERARHMLEQEERSIAEVSSLLGFCDQSHFCRVFRRATGTTPRRYAQAHAAIGDLSP
ncbi:MAG: helix-turn-helix domain-containing protein [Panacagrimonas sp.]